MSLKDEISGLGGELAAAINAKDAGAAASLYTEDAAMLPPGAPRFDGRSGVQTYWQAGIDGGLANVVLTTLEVEEHGETATEVGSVTATMGDTAFTGKFMVIWKKTASGWKLHRDIFNMDA